MSGLENPQVMSNSSYRSLASELSFIKTNQASIVGFAIWAAGAFDTTYTLTVTPNADGSDQPLWVDAGECSFPSPYFYLSSERQLRAYSEAQPSMKTDPDAAKSLEMYIVLSQCCHDLSFRVIYGTSIICT